MDAVSRGINRAGTHRRLPPTMHQDQLKKATLSLNSLLAGALTSAAALEIEVAGALDAIILENGFAVVRRATLQGLIPDYNAMWDAARGELVALQGEGGALPEKLFHNESEKIGSVNVGNSNRTAGTIDPDGPCRNLLDAVIKVVTNGSFQLLESHDGILQASSLHNKAQDHADYDPQAHHMDNRVLADVPFGRPEDGVHVGNIRSMADSRTAARTAWANMGSEPIRLSVFPGSHKLAQVCERSYACHYQSVRDSSGLDGRDLLEVWAAISAMHLANQFPELEKAGAATVPAEPGDFIFMLGNFVHGGTGDEGLRLFGAHVHKSQANSFHHVNNSTELIGNSSVYAGLRAYCVPDDSGLPWQLELEELKKQAQDIFSSEQRGQRTSRVVVESLLDSLLRRWNTEKHGWCRPDMGQKVLSIGGNLAAVQFKEGCNKKRTLLVFLELRRGLPKQGSAAAGVGRDIRNSPAVCHAMCQGELSQRIRRSDAIGVAHPAWPALAGYTDVVGDYRICWAAVELPLCGEPLEAMFSEWNDTGVLTEPLRWRVLALFRALEHLWPAGFCMGKFDSSMFVYDPHADKIVLVFAGNGRLGPSDYMVANGAPVPGPCLMSRRTTSCYVGQEEVAETVDPFYFKDLKEQAAKLVAASAENGEAEDDDWGDGVEARELLPHQLSRARAKLEGKKVGFPRVPTEAMFLDDELRKLVFAEEEVEWKKVRHLAKHTDLHQVLLWLVSMFAKRPWGDSLRRDLLGLLNPLFDNEAAINFMLEKCFAKRQTRQSPGIQQPAGCRRVAQLLAFGLREETRDAVIRELSLMPAVGSPLHSPAEELQLAGGGIRVLLNPYPIQGEDFRAKADAAIQSAGLLVGGEKRWVSLINEHGKGVGVQVSGDFAPNCFFGFYIGVAGEGRSRYVASTPGQGEVVGERCDAAPCKDLPLSWYICQGVPCPFINAATTEDEANITLHRRDVFTHNWNGKKLVCIPMGVRVFIPDKSFTAWLYPFAAAHGRSMTF